MTWQGVQAGCHGITYAKHCAAETRPPSFADWFHPAQKTHRDAAMEAACDAAKSISNNRPRAGRTDRNGNRSRIFTASTEQSRTAQKGDG
jgi:hypothetical protein